MHLAFLFIITVLAVWRLTHMIYEEEGPFGIFARLQAWSARQPDTVGGINHAFDCFYCLSMWVSLIPAFLMSWNLTSFLVLWFAISGGAVLLFKKEQ